MKLPMSAVIFLCAASLLFQCTEARGQFTAGEINIESAPFQYSATEPNNRVSRLIAKLESKELKLDYSRDQGYLQSLLAALEIPESSQTLVFSKTSLQVRFISRRNPRAIYFNDDTYVGWVNGSTLMEIATEDPQLGTVFYTVDMMPWRAKIKRAGYECLGCHSTSMTQGIPGHTVRSVMPKIDGTVDPQSLSYVTDDRSPFSERWGGWYVTGSHGEMTHMGNTFVRGGTLDVSENGNRLNLRQEFDTSNYLSPYSDIVALMVLEHQTQTSNAMTRADFFVRKLLHDLAENSQQPASDPEFNVQLAQHAKEVVDYLLFVGEFTLTDEVRGSSPFEEEFTARGPTDKLGRSLRDFDLKSQLFTYPCSYLIYSTAFDSLQPPLKTEILKQLRSVLTNEDDAERFRHLDESTRQAIHEILTETKPEYAALAGQAKN